MGRVPLLTRCHADVIEGEIGDTGVELEQQGEGLANATSGAQNSHLGQLEVWRVSNGCPGRALGAVPLRRAKTEKRETSAETLASTSNREGGSYLASRCREGTALDTSSSKHGEGVDSTGELRVSKNERGQGQG